MNRNVAGDSESPATGCNEVSAALSADEVQRDRVHAVALAAGIAWAVVEDVAQVRVAAGAAHLRPHHAVRAVLAEFDRARQRLREAWPAATGVELRLAVEELVAARRAAIDTV